VLLELLEREIELLVDITCKRLIWHKWCTDTYGEVSFLSSSQFTEDGAAFVRAVNKQSTVLKVCKQQTGTSGALFSKCVLVGTIGAQLSFRLFIQVFCPYQYPITDFTKEKQPKRSLAQVVHCSVSVS